jgi:hypothetical protein
MKKSLRLLAPVAALGVIGLLPGVASAQTSGASYQAQLDALNGSGASGTVTLQLTGDQATITEKVSGLAASFMNAPYPHVQHIHGGGMGQCPTAAADKNGDGVVNVKEGAPSYGGIQTTLSTSGDTSPTAGTELKIAPSGGSFTYNRTITLDAATLASVKGGTAVVVVHGLDPASLSAQAQGEMSEIVPSLPLAATSPAVCGVLQASQMSTIPSGAADTGNGSSGGASTELLAVGTGALAVAAVGGVAVARRRRTEG